MLQKIYPLFLLFLVLIQSCSQADPLSSQSVVSVDHHSKTSLDKWIYEHFTAPYNVEVVYQWDKNKAPKGTYNIPPDLDKIQAVLQTIKELWIDVYTSEELGKKDFLKGKMPLRIYLYGGRNLDYNGVELLGNPSASTNEMFLYNVNTFDATNKDKVYMLMRSVHHQFAKQLTAFFPYNRDAFLSISRKRYTYSTEFLKHLVVPNFNIYYYQINGYANTRGFYTCPAFFSAEDDFAEIISCNLLSKPSEITEALHTAKTPDIDISSGEAENAKKEAQEIYEELLAKQNFVNKYFSETIHIPLNKLQLISIQKYITFFQP